MHSQHSEAREYIEKGEDDAEETPGGVLGEDTGDKGGQGSPSAVMAAETAAPFAMLESDASAKGTFLCTRSSVFFSLSGRPVKADFHVFVGLLSERYVLQCKEVGWFYECYER